MGITLKNLNINKNTLVMYSTIKKDRCKQSYIDDIKWYQSEINHHLELNEPLEVKRARECQYKKASNSWLLTERKRLRNLCEFYGIDVE